MPRAVYVDASPTATNGRRRRKPHNVFDRERTFKVNKLTKLKNVDEVFIDTLFPEVYDEILELLRRGVKVYLLRDTEVFKRLRLQNNLKKSDENDALMFSKVAKEYFRALTIHEIEKRASYSH